MKKLILFIICLFVFIGCDEANVASYNLSNAADMFEINRRVVFYNGITDKYILLIEGRCAVEFYSDKFEVTVKTGPKTYMKHYLGRADNVFPFVEQIDGAEVSPFHYRVVFRPKTIVPNIEIDN